ncbi:peptidylprolyl isomerase [Poriferisphaera corsica]|uniref:Peptidylprolyl isomerase n=1 Tax=Poriferisphaera corsica TaxID=2528020 RepID=A0A517YXW0_9BACT|nr:peptidylprolyl isomerase [Poriferisphaera corsica]QDU35055.1 peptidylprolyl isomerase [Poriferisphaera corsica]
MTKTRSAAILTLTTAACINLAGCALFIEQDTGPSNEELRAIEQEYRVREQKQAEAYAKEEVVVSNDNSLVMNAMIGQVNGNAIYAENILAPIHDQLTALGQNLSRDAFYREIRGNAQQLGIIAQNIRSNVTNALIYGDAERHLTNNERYIVKIYIQKNREFFIRQHGQGSQALANKTMLEKFGIGIEESLENERRKYIIQQYVNKTIRPKVNVTRADIERYYRDHKDDFNKPNERDIRIIATATADNALQVQSQLESGISFDQIASSELNTYRRSSGGLSTNLKGERVLAPFLKPLNDALNQLATGQSTTEPIEIKNKYWFIKLDRVQEAQNITLRQAQLGIRKLLEDQQFNILVERYNRDLLTDGSYDNLDEMTKTLIQIAMNRYAQPESN